MGATDEGPVEEGNAAAAFISDGRSDLGGAAGGQSNKLAAALRAAQYWAVNGLKAGLQRVAAHLVSPGVAVEQGGMEAAVLDSTGTRVGSADIAETLTVQDANGTLITRTGRVLVEVKNWRLSTLTRQLSGNSKLVQQVNRFLADPSNAYVKVEFLRTADNPVTASYGRNLILQQLREAGVTNIERIGIEFVDNVLDDALTVVRVGL